MTIGYAYIGQTFVSSQPQYSNNTDDELQTKDKYCYTYGELDLSYMKWGNYELEWMRDGNFWSEQCWNIMQAAIVNGLMMINCLVKASVWPWLTTGAVAEEHWTRSDLRIERFIHIFNSCKMGGTYLLWIEVNNINIDSHLLYYIFGISVTKRRKTWIHECID